MSLKAMNRRPCSGRLTAGIRNSFRRSGRRILLEPEANAQSGRLAKASLIALAPAVVDSSSIDVLQFSERRTRLSSEGLQRLVMGSGLNK